jgi:hypothetical protein
MKSLKLVWLTVIQLVKQVCQLPQVISRRPVGSGSDSLS